MSDYHCIPVFNGILPNVNRSLGVKAVVYLFFFVVSVDNLLARTLSIALLVSAVV